MKNETTLVQAFQRGDRQAFAELITQYQNYVATVAYTATGDLDFSEDITQQTFLTAWQKQRELRDPSKWLGWIGGIARNLVRNEFRRRKTERTHRQGTQQRAESARPIDPTPVERCINKEQSQLLWSVLESVPEPYREPLVLYYWEGKSVSRVAELLELSEDAVKQRLSRGRKRIKEEISQFVDEALQETKPQPQMAAGILAAIPVVAKGAAAKAAGPAIGSLFSLKTLTILAGPLLGIFGAAYGSKKSLDNATSKAERTFLWKMIVGSTLIALLFVAVQFIGLTFFREFFQRSLVQIIIGTFYSIVLFSAIVAANRHLASIKKEHGTPGERAGNRGMQQQTVSTLALRLNAIGMIAGTSAFAIVFASLTADWLALTIVVGVVLLLIATAVSIAPLCRTAADQIRFNGIAGLMTAIFLAMVVWVRWDHWSETIKMLPNLSGWFLATLIAGFGVLLFVFLEIQARRIRIRAPKSNE